MLIKPDLKDEIIIKCLWDVYGLSVENIRFLPLGADFNTAVYRVTTNSQADYFLKLRRAEFIDAAVLVPKYLADQSLKHVIPPLTTETGQLWADLASFKAILYPYIEGRNGIEKTMSDRQWIEFGEFMKRFHSTVIPETLTTNIKREAFSGKWREKVRAFLESIKNEAFTDPVAVEMALFLKSKSREIYTIINRAEELACLLQKQPLEYILCHADIHGWNVLIDKKGVLYVVDWDTLIFAPKERDLMFIGARIGDSGRTPIEEESLFYQGYGQTEINQDAIAYYRFERIIQDIGEYCEQIFMSNDGDEDRLQSFEYLQSNFLPNSTLERAFHSDKAFTKNR